MSDLDYLKSKCEQYNNYFFTQGALEFFNSTIGKVLRIDANTYRVVTGEKFEDNPRRYTVREFVIDQSAGSVYDSNVSDFQEYATRAEAIKHLKDGI